jgi:hypothetical protein
MRSHASYDCYARLQTKEWKVLVTAFNSYFIGDYDLSDPRRFCFLDRKYLLETFDLRRIIIDFFTHLAPASSPCFASLSSPCFVLLSFSLPHLALLAAKHFHECKRPREPNPESNFATI